MFSTRESSCDANVEQTAENGESKSQSAQHCKCQQTRLSQKLQEFWVHSAWIAGFKDFLYLCDFPPSTPSFRRKREEIDRVQSRLQATLPVVIVLRCGQFEDVNHRNVSGVAHISSAGGYEVVK